MNEHEQDLMLRGMGMRGGYQPTAREHVVTNVSDLSPAMRAALNGEPAVATITLRAMVARGLMTYGIGDGYRLTEAGERARLALARRPDADVAGDALDTELTEGATVHYGPVEDWGTQAHAYAYGLLRGAVRTALVAGKGGPNLWAALNYCEATLHASGYRHGQG